MKKFIHFMILSSLLVAGGSFVSSSNLQAQKNEIKEVFDVDAAIEARDYEALTEYYRGLADEQREIAEVYQRKMWKSRMNYTSRGGQTSMEARYREAHYEALEKADEYDSLAGKYEKLINKNGF